MRDQDSLTTMKEDLENKLESADVRRQEKLGEIVLVAQKSAEKRKHSGEHLAAAPEQTL